MPPHSMLSSPMPIAMEGLRQLIAGSAAGQKLLAALEPHATGDLPGLVAAVLQERSQNVPPVANNDAQQARASLDGAASVIKGLTFLTPRGKQDLVFLDDAFVVRTSKADIEVPYTAIKQLAILEIPKDPKNRMFLFLNIAPEAKVLNGKQPVTAIVIQTAADAQLDISHPKEEGERLAGVAPVVVCQAFGLKGLSSEAFCSPDLETFKSAGGLAGVQAFVKASEGTLFPMAAGLCFLERPAMFIPRGAIKAVEFARAGGASSTFDLYVHLRDGRAQEFSNISRAEIGAFEDFVRRTRLPIGTGESSSEEGEDEGPAGEEGGGPEASSGSRSEGSDSDDPEDEDFNPTSSSSGEEGEESDGEGGRSSGLAAGGSGGGHEGPSTSTAGKRKRAGSAPAGSGGVGSGSSSDEAEDESSEEDDDEGSVELVSEDEFSVGQLRSVIEKEGSQAKRQRR